MHEEEEREAEDLRERVLLVRAGNKVNLTGFSVYQEEKQRKRS